MKRRHLTERARRFLREVGSIVLGVSTNYASIDRPFPVLVNGARSNPRCRPL